MNRQRKPPRRRRKRNQRANPRNRGAAAHRKAKKARRQTSWKMPKPASGKPAISPIWRFGAAGAAGAVGAAVPVIVPAVATELEAPGNRRKATKERKWMKP